ncbi:membrane protein [Arenicella chitinivorans]|uniref:Membrane protein n=1 Tax=Arenicella chitinivorans TaxID=1329800 RepID=A0A918RWM9_9GAMM|nr:MAPEG family protein [Arenicella chitinivorans]GHA15454.1 membrane protein [Arenicella chitinivorans]
MQSTLIYWPVLLQLSIPLWVIGLNGVRKAAARKAGLQRPESTVDNKAWPLPVVLTSNALDNQFQFPVVFYVLCLMLAHSGGVTLLSLALAWLYVGLRWVHAMVHVTNNVIALRFGFFLASMLVLLGLFFTCVVHLAF